MSEHTSTPWHYERDEFHSHVLAENNGLICTAEDPSLIDDDVGEANAKLIVQSVNIFAALADHLGCDPAELEGLDLVKLVETLQAVEKWWIGDSTESFSGPVGNEQMMQEYAGLIQQIRQAVAQLPERKT